MIFWIVTAVIVVIWIGAVVTLTQEDGLGGFLMAFFVGGLFAGVVWLIIGIGLIGAGATRLVGANQTDTYPVPLKALGADSSTTGTIFLGSGFVDGKRVLSYIQENDDGSFTPGQVDSSASRVYEVDTKPELVWHVNNADHWWLYPVEVEVSRSFEFYVPEGSVSEEYNVTP